MPLGNGDCPVNIATAQGPQPYYVHMAIAWYLAAALAKFPDLTRTYVRTTSLPVAIYCSSGRLSKFAAKRMTNAGLQVTKLSEGILS